MLSVGRFLSCLSLVVLVACGGSSGSSTDSGPGGGSTDGSPGSGSGNYFPDGAEWTRDITGDSVDADSDEIIGWLDGQGWGLGRMQIDFSLEVLAADSNTERRPFARTGDWYMPDCDEVPVPVPAGGNLEGEDGYACDSDGDCHLIVVEEDERKLYEMWRADIRGDTFRGGCLAVWELDRLYGPLGRGDQCTSADAAGFPIAPLLFTADEVAAGEIAHAIRFILPNSRMRDDVYVRPATHAGGPSGPASAPPYGVRLRLRADFPLEDLASDGARVVARAMQTYGMLLADGGNVALTAQSDRHTVAKWAGLLEPRDLDIIQPADFEVVEMGDIIDVTYDCVRL
jgi:serine/threonine-protein kinase